MTDHEKKLAAAKERVAQMDMNDGHEDRSIGTLIVALECGLSGTDDGPAYDALAMLLDIRSVVKNLRDLNVVSIKAIFKSLDDGDRVSIKLIPKSDPNQN